MELVGKVTVVNGVGLGMAGCFATAGMASSSPMWTAMLAAAETGPGGRDRAVLGVAFCHA